MSSRSNRKRKLRLIAIFGRWCHICEKPIGKRAAVSVDHVVPKSEGGTNDIENLRPAHRGCNSKRGNKPWPNPIPFPVEKVSTSPTMIEEPQSILTVSGDLLARTADGMRASAS